MKQLAIILICLFAVSANALTKEQIEEKFNLPPEPDQEANNATIEGIDSNNNDIRDDWERAIAFEYYKDSTMMNIHNLFANNYTNLNVAYALNQEDLYIKHTKEAITLVSCFYYYDDDNNSSNYLWEMRNNTELRFYHNMERDSIIAKSFGASIVGLTENEKKKICPKYLK